MSDAIVVFSGGPDSTAAALWARKQGLSPNLLTFQFENKAQYGELCAAIAVSSALGLPHEIVDFKSPLHVFPAKLRILMHAGTRPLPRDPAAASAGTSYLLPFGPGLILSFAAAVAISRGFETVVWGATKDDSVGNNDYSQQFGDELAALIAKATGRPMRIQVPFHSAHKHEVLGGLVSHAGLFALTWSCKREGVTQCGECGACVARRTAALMASLQDGTAYVHQSFTPPFSPQQLASPSTLSSDALSKVLGSEPIDPLT